jgi:hypothetical protein
MFTLRRDRLKSWKRCCRHSHGQVGALHGSGEPRFYLDLARFLLVKRCS